MKKQSLKFYKARIRINKRQIALNIIIIIIIGPVKGIITQILIISCSLHSQFFLVKVCYLFFNCFDIANFPPLSKSLNHLFRPYSYMCS